MEIGSRAASSRTAVLMGGIPTDINGQVVIPDSQDGMQGSHSVVEGLYAIGECACVSVHGANRLGTNSLLDLIVFGRATGRYLVNKNISAEGHKKVPSDGADRTIERIKRLDSNKSGEDVMETGNRIRETTQKYCGVFRNEELLRKGAQKILDIDGSMDKLFIKDKSAVFNTARIEAIEIFNMIEVAKATIISADARKESRGAHSHDNFAERDDKSWMKHTLWFSKDNRLDYKPVILKPSSVESFAPKKRTF